MSTSDDHKQLFDSRLAVLWWRGLRLLIVVGLPVHFGFKCLLQVQGSNTIAAYSVKTRRWLSKTMLAEYKSIILFGKRQTSGGLVFPVHRRIYTGRCITRSKYVYIFSGIRPPVQCCTACVTVQKSTYGENVDKGTVLHVRMCTDKWI